MNRKWTIMAAGALAAAGLAGGAAAQEAKKSWADTLSFRGDVRYRYEAIQDDSKTDADGDTYTRGRTS